MVLRIAVVDDNDGFQQQLISLIMDWAERSGQEVNITPYIHGQSFLFDWEDRPLFDAILLDIRMPGMDGLEVARHIRQTDSDVALVFITSLAEKAVKGFEWGAKRFLIKPVDQQAVDTCMQVVLESVNASPKSAFIYQKEMVRFRVPIRDIMYFESDAHYVNLYTPNDVRTFVDSLKEIEPTLPSYFVRCSRSYLVNIDYVHAFTATKIILKNGKEVSIGKRYARDVQEAFLHNRVNRPLQVAKEEE